MSLKEFASEEEAYYYDENDINYGISFDDKYDVTKSPSQLNKQSPNDNSESSIQQFKFLIISLAFFLISIGILLNVLFSLLVICRKPGRQTSTTIITLSMSFAYLIYLSFYALKVTIYLEGDNIAKYHMYDTIDNWKYGEFMCQFVSGLPVFVKFVCRFSIIVICLERLFKIVESNFLIENDFNNGDDEQKMLNEQEEVKSNSNSKIKNKSQSNLAIKRSVFHFLLKAFKWPILPILIFIIWLVSLLATLPLFSSYRLDEPNEYSIASASSMCNSVFKFPEDINKVSTMYWNYMIYGLIIPCSICGSCLIILGIIQFYNMNSVSSFKQKNLNNTGHSSSISSSSSFTHSTSVDDSCFKRNNMLIWLMLLVHLATTLPQQIYRYIELSADFNDQTVLDNYLMSSLTEPIFKARCYYGLQLLTLSEAIIMPCLFIIVFWCSMCNSRQTRSNSNFNEKKCNLSESSLLKCFQNCLFDTEMSKSRNNANFFNIHSKETTNNKPSKRLFLQTPNDEPKNPCQNNVMHIIQHPSWRINIKQQQTDN